MLRDEASWSIQPSLEHYLYHLLLSAIVMNATVAS